MVRTAIRLAGFVGLLAVIGAGCVVEVEFNPIGDEVSLDGAWEIDVGSGAVPADASSCAAAGIATVQLIIFEEGRTTRWVDSQFRFPCSQGGFDTRPNRVLLHDRYTTQWVAYDAAGTELGASDLLLLDVSLVDHATLATPVFSSTPTWNPMGDEVSLDGMWAIDLMDGAGAQPANVTNCAAANIATVQMVIYEETGSTPWVDSIFNFPCEQGAFDTRPDRVLRQDRYSTEWAAYDPSGVELGRSTRLLLDVSLVNHATLAPAVFEVAAPPTGDLQLNISWDELGGPSYVGGTCASAKVMEMTYDMRTAAGDPIADSGGRIACTEQITFEGLFAGEYSVYIEGFDAGVQNWMGTCDMLLLAGGGVEIFNCDIDWE